MKKLISCLMVVATVTTLFAGCGNNNKVKKNEIVVGVQQDFDSLDPHLVEAAGTREVLFNVFEGLVKVKPDGSLKCAVAKSYSISEDGKVYTFVVKDNIKFHNGKILTTEDVKYSIERNAGLLGGAALDKAFTNISAVNIKEGNVVEIVLKEADTEFISYLTEAIIPKERDNGEIAPAGTGPFYIEQYVPGEKLVVKKYADYHDVANAAKLEKVTFKVVNAATAIIELKAGSIDLYPYLTSDQATELEGYFDILSGNANIVQGLFLNNSLDKFKDIRIRQALNHAINRQEILDIVADGKGTILGSALYSGFGRYYNGELANYYAYDVNKAKELIKEVLGDEKLSFTVKVPSNYEVHMSTALVIREQLKKADIEMTIDAVDWNTWLTEVYVGGNYETTIIGFDSLLAPKDMMRRYATNGSGNMTKFSDEEYDKLYLEALATTDDAKKIELYKKMQEIVTKKAASVFIQDNAVLLAINKKLKGYVFYPIYVQDMSVLYFE